MARAKNQPLPSAVKLLNQPHVLEWIRGDLNFLRRPDDEFKNKTAETGHLYPRENDWAWELYGKAAPWHKAYRKGMWSGAFGQLIFQELAPGGWKPKQHANYQLDWEDDNFVYELKTQFHLSGGTAQEKIPAVPIKYLEVPELFGKPLKIVCLAGAETYAREFLKDCPKIRDQLALWKSWNIEYVWGSDLIKGLESS